MRTERGVHAILHACDRPLAEQRSAHCTHLSANNTMSLPAKSVWKFVTRSKTAGLGSGDPPGMKRACSQVRTASNLMAASPMDSSKPVSESAVNMEFVVTQAHCRVDGSLNIGQLLQWMDIAACLAAVRRVWIQTRAVQPQKLEHSSGYYSALHLLADADSSPTRDRSGIVTATV